MASGGGIALTKGELSLRRLYVVCGSKGEKRVGPKFVVGCRAKLLRQFCVRVMIAPRPKRGGGKSRVMEGEREKGGMGSGATWPHKWVDVVFYLCPLRLPGGQCAHSTVSASFCETIVKTTATAKGRGRRKEFKRRREQKERSAALPQHLSESLITDGNRETESC